MCLDVGNNLSKRNIRIRGGILMSRRLSAVEAEHPEIVESLETLLEASQL